MGDGNNIVAGGVGADQITTGANEDLVLGDNGQFQFTTNSTGTAILTGARTTDTVDQPTWGDTIVTGDGNNVVLAGMGADHVNDPAVSTITQPSNGNDIVLGDNGQIAWDIAGRVQSFSSTQPTFGGDDVIVVDNGDNIVVGGFGNDEITTGTGTDVVIGDNGQVTYTPARRSCCRRVRPTRRTRPAATTSSRRARARRAKATTW